MSGKPKSSVMDELAKYLKFVLSLKTETSVSDRELGVPPRPSSSSTEVSDRYHSIQEQRAARQVAVRNGQRERADSPSSSRPGTSTNKDTEWVATWRLLDSAKDCDASQTVAAVKVQSLDRFLNGNIQYGWREYGGEQERDRVSQSKRLVREPASFNVATGKTFDKTKGSFPNNTKISSRTPNTLPEACCHENKQETRISGKLSGRTHKPPDDEYTDRSSLEGILETANRQPASYNYSQLNEAHSRISSCDQVSEIKTRFDERGRNGPKPLREKLPICEHHETIVQYIANHRVTCIQGETGCGKSSMVPQFVLEYYEKNSPSYVKHLPPRAAQEYQANIVVTQPRRLAAKTLARRVASDLGEEVGTTVGYAIARDSKRSSDTRITFVTTGYLLQLLVSNPQSFQRYTHVILDEIHERQIDSDLLSLVIKLCLTQKNKTKIIVMSATLQGKLFTKYFTESVDNPLRATVIPEPIFVGARRFPVGEFYLERLLSMSQLLPSLDARDIKSIVKAWISFSASSPTDVTSTVLQSIRRINHPDLFDDNEVSPSGIRSSFRKQRTKIPFPQIQDGLLDVGEKLIMTFAKTGETTLVFLPGMADIQEMFEKLEPYEMNPEKKVKIRLFVLHSLIPNDEQEAAFKDPPGDTAHVILATNIAESSLTLPKVRVVIDYGLRKQCVYNPGRQMSSIQYTWISRASALQRTGRTGRVFEGSVFRMYTEHFYGKILEEFDPPEMETSPLDKLVLRTKWIGQNIAPDVSVRQLLNQAVQPPSLEQLEAAIERLADVGALTGNSEEAAVTLIGHAALRLPLDLLQCRLVVYGIIMGCPCDAIVMAASMTLRQEPFSLPLRMIMKDARTYLASLKRSFTSRIQFDGGLYSEPIMMRNLFMAWLQSVLRSGSHDTGLTHNAERSQEASECYQDPLARTAARVNAARKRFCKENALHCKRFKEFETSVAEVASRVISFLAKDSKGFREVTDLMRILCTDEDDDVTLNFAVDDIKGQARSSDCASTPAKPAPTQWFREDSTIVKALLVASFSPTFIEGTCFDEIKRSGLQVVNKCERTAAAMGKNGFDPKTSVALNNILQGNAELKGNPKMVDEIVGLACEPQRTGFGGTPFQTEQGSQLITLLRWHNPAVTKYDDRIFIEFSYDCWMHQDRTLLHDVPFKAHILSQFGEGRRKFAVPLPKGTLAYKMCRRDQLEFDQPIQPYRLNWMHTTQRRNEPQAHSLQAFMKNWRNPVGFACDTRGRQIKHYAVAAGIEGDAKKCHVQWVTVLPSENDGFLAKVMMLAFISQNYKVEFTLSAESPKMITEVQLSGMSLQFSQKCPLTFDTLSKINEVRSAFSEIFKSCSDGRCKISDGKVSRALKELFQSCRSPAAFTSTLASEGRYGIHRTVSAFRKDSSKATAGSPFIILEIYSGRKYLDRLDELIHGSETAKRALRQKDEGILIDGQKKRKSTKKAEKIDLICVQIFQAVLNNKIHDVTTQLKIQAKGKEANQNNHSSSEANGPMTI